MKVHIKNGRVIDPANDIDAQLDVFIDEGKIVAIAEQLDGFIAEEVIDAKSRLIIPGLVDLSARLREPGHEHAATIASETLAAVKGGVTTLCVPPDTHPVIDTPAVAELIEDRAKKAGRTMVLTVGALTKNLESEFLSEMLALKEAGCAAVSNGLNAIKNTLIQQRAFEYAATLDLTVFITAADPWLAREGCAHDGVVSTRLGLAGIAEEAETIALSRDLLLVEKTGVRAHFHNISTGKAISLLREAQDKGLPVTADVSAHHLHLTEHDIANYDSLTHVLPPLRSTRDREQLQQGVREGVISAIASHHQPLDHDAKLGPFAETTAGISALETLVPLTFKLVSDNVLSLNEAVASVTSKPAAILNINSGQLKVGWQADICIINPNAHVDCQPKDFSSAGKNSPFKGWLFSNQVVHTLIKGQTVFKLDS